MTKIILKKYLDFKGVSFFQFVLLFLFAIAPSWRTFAVVKTPNFDFSLLTPYLPGEKMPAKEKLPPPIKIGKKTLYQIVLKDEQFWVELSLIEKEDVITEVFISFPSYFLHDTFLQSLHNRWKKQNQYVHDPLQESAMYFWNNIDEKWAAIYDAHCTITCFPRYLSVRSKAIDLKESYPYFLMKEEAQ
jgi:hypothetical protein